MKIGHHGRVTGRPKSLPTLNNGAEVDEPDRPGLIPAAPGRYPAKNKTPGCPGADAGEPVDRAGT